MSIAPKKALIGAGIITIAFLAGGRGYKDYEKFKHVSHVQTQTPTPTPGPTSTPIPTPVAPSGLAALTISQSEIDLSWDNNEVDSHQVRIFRSANGPLSTIATVSFGVDTYQDTGLSASTTYTYYVAALKNSVLSPNSNSAIATTTSAPTPTPIPTPLAPSNLVATATGSANVDLAWVNNAAQIDSQIIERCTGASCVNFGSVITLSPAKTSSADTTTVASTLYRYRLKNVFLGQSSLYSNISEVTTPADAAVPNAPTAFSATASSTTQINTAWTDNATNETGFDFQRCTGIDCSNFTPIFSLSADVVSKSDTGLTPSTIYCYKVRAFNGNGSSTFSNEAGDQTPAPVTTPVAPSALTATAVSSSQINLAWTDNSNNETNFEIQSCSGTSCSSFSQLNLPAANATSYNHTGLTQSTSYSYKIRATNSAGSSAYSSTATATTPALPTCGASEDLSGAVAAFCLGEASGNVIDSISGISLSPFGGPTYSVATTQTSPIDVTGFSPGVDITGTRGFQILTAQSAMNMGTGDARFTWVQKKNSLAAPDEIIFAQDANQYNGVYCEWYNPSFPRIYCQANASQFVVSTCSWNTSGTNSAPNDGKFHKYELFLTRAANMTLNIDGVAQGSGCSMASTVGAAINNNGMFLGSSLNGATSVNGQILFWKQGSL